MLSRGAFEGLERQFPVAARTVLFNLQRHAESLVEQEFPDQRKSKVLPAESPVCSGLLHASSGDTSRVMLHTKAEGSSVYAQCASLVGGKHYAA